MRSDGPPFLAWRLMLASLLGPQLCLAGAMDFGLRITPELPRPFQTITVHALQPPCGSFGPLTSSEVEGDVVRVVVPYSENLLCIPGPIVPFQWTIPGVAEGDYRLELLDGSPTVPPYLLLDAVNMQVALGTLPEPRVVTSTSWISLVALALLLTSAAHWTCGRRA
jgi:hypothetical protein